MRRSGGRLEPRSKVWLELNGQAVFGDGKARMLRTIEQTGSLTSAARMLGMSYRGLWERLGRMEKRLGVKLVSRRTGGPGGGGSHLTPQGHQLLEEYERFRDGINRFVDERFDRVFSRATTRKYPPRTPPRRQRRSRTGS